MKCVLILIATCLWATAGDISPAKQKQMVAEIDKTVIKKHLQEGIKSSPLVNDEVFLRRIYIDAVGRIPTLDEAKDFLNSKDRNKRDKLIDNLLNSPGYVSHNFNYWADVLRLTDRMRYGSAPNYKAFVRKAVQQDMPYNNFVGELLSSNGKAYDPKNGAVGYYLRDPGMPLDNLSNSMQIFLGTSMVCAQCHDHPFDKWSQMDFYKLAAFTAGTTTNRYSDRSNPDNRKLNEYRKEIRTNENKYRFARTVTEVINSGVYHGGTGMIRLPHDYDYEDAKPHEIIKAETPYGPKVVLEFPEIKEDKNSKKKKKKKNRKKMPAPGSDINSRTAFAQWITSRKNPMFTKTIVNRMWDKVMGAPLVGPLMNISEKKMGANPELTELLTKQMQEVNFSLKEFSRILFKTKLYQRKAVTSPPDGEKNYFIGPQIRRMTAEQMWDSLMALTVDKPDANVALTSTPSSKEVLYYKVKDMNFDQLKALVEKFGEDKAYLKQLTRNEGMSMAMEAGMKNETRRLNKEESEIKARYKDLDKKIAKAKKNKDWNTVKKLMPEFNEVRTTMNDLKKMRNMNKRAKNFARASEMRSPMTPNHFLRRFGSSDREIIDGSSAEPSVPQALSLLNGQIEDFVTANSVSSINRHMSEAETVEDKIKTAFLCILTRSPNSSEISLFKQQFAKDEKQASKDLIWVLINSNEFIFLN